MSYGTLQFRPKDFEETGIEQIISYMQVHGDGLWRRPPVNCYIPAAHLLVEERQFDSIFIDYRIITRWCKRMRQTYRIDNVAATTDHRCRFRDVDQRNWIEHTHSCKLVSRDPEVERTIHRLYAAAGKGREATPSHLPQHNHLHLRRPTPVPRCGSLPP